MLFEALLSIFKNNPKKMWFVFKAFFHGKVKFKHSLCEFSSVDISSLPYRDEVLSYIKSNRTNYSAIYLVTGSPLSTAQRVANHLGIFDGVIATEDKNVIGKIKADKLVNKFGLKKFDYMGDSYVDLPVWEMADKAIVVGSFKLKSHDHERIHVESKRLKPFFKLLRPQQWLKNLLVFLPMILSHKLNDLESNLSLAVGFISFSFLASTVYIFNDLLDVSNDRLHYRKKTRPFANGDISIPFGVALALLMLAFAFGVAYLNGPGSNVLLTYLCLNILYSTFLKRQVLIDIFLLTSFYLLRILYGGEVAGVEVSYWLLSFSFFIFTSLAFVKRHSELLMQFKTSGAKSSVGRGYHFEDLILLQTLGVGAGLLASLVLGLYFHLGENVVLYTSPQFLLGIEVIMLYWISRLWFLSSRNKMHDDPVKFAFTDPVSIFCGIACLALGALAK